MSYLLDTHVFLWVLFASNRLSKNSREVLLGESNDVYVSIISFWEISLKYSLGKLSLKGVSPADLPALAAESGFDVMDIDAATVSTFHELPASLHRDPFDRLLIWQAIKRDCTVLSKDREFARYGEFGLRYIW